MKTVFNRMNWMNKNKMLDKMLDKTSSNAKIKGLLSSEALSLLWRECVRIELTMDLISPTTGFEVR